MATSLSGGAVVGGDSAARATGRASSDGDGDALVVGVALGLAGETGAVVVAGSALVDVDGCAALVVVGRRVVEVALGIGRGDVVATCASWCAGRPITTAAITPTNRTTSAIQRT